jgi:uncharacterized protein YegP (UPF0339 family)
MLTRLVELALTRRFSLVYMATYYIKKDAKFQYYWILKSSNGETVCMSSEAYASKQGVEKSLTWNQANGSTTHIVDLA